MPPASSACATPHPGDRRENRCLEASKVELCSRLNPSKKKKKRKTRIMAEHEPAQTSRAFVAPLGRFCHRCWEKHPPAEALPPCRTNRRGEQTLCQGAIAVAQVIPLQAKGPMRPKRTKGSVQTAASDVTSTAHRQLSETTTSML